MNMEENNNNQTENTDDLATQVITPPDTEPLESQGDTQNPTDSLGGAYNYEPSSTEHKTQRMNSKIRLGLEIIGGVLLLIMIFSSIGKVPQEKYDALKDKHAKQTKELEDTNISLEEIKAEYASYKQKMSAFEGLTEEETETLLAEVDKLTAKKEAEEEAARQAAAEKAAAEKEAAEKAAAASVSQKNALSKAREYLDYTAFSHSGLIGQLEYEGFSTEDATYAADNCGADWKEQAAKKAQEYMDYSSFSRAGLIDQLIYEGFSSEQAEYGVSAVGY